ncbi:hypothetical protein Tco_0047645 [Tanacetum coccineum]
MITDDHAIHNFGINMDFDLYNVKELHKEKLKAVATLKSLQQKLEEEFTMEIDRKLNKLKDLAKAELIAVTASKKAFAKLKKCRRRISM